MTPATFPWVMRAATLICALLGTGSLYLAWIFATHLDVPSGESFVLVLFSLAAAILSGAVACVTWVESKTP